MVQQKRSKRQRDIKQKLMAAICMLLVSSIMMVSTTYAWFTLSTAPEVTGISTSVGANGNLEMALLPASGNVADITSSAGDSTKAINLKNNTWGNLVDVSENTFYGMDKIQLYPAALNPATEDTNGNPKTLNTALLQTPTYGSDGRVSELAKNTVTSTYDADGNQGFPQNNEYGVRAVGVASGMTDRQLTYRNARSAANTAMAQAKTVASQSLNNNGSSLANVALKKATSNAPTFTQTDVASLQKIVNDLLGYSNEEGKHVTGVLEYVETAYVQYILAYAASNATNPADGVDDTIYNAVKVAVDSGAELDDLITAMGGKIPGSLSNYVTNLKATETKVMEAKTALEALATSGSNEIPWDGETGIGAPLHKLADTDAMKINGYAASTVKENMSAIINSVASGGLTVTIATGGGVYADVADHCGDFNASVTIASVEYNGLVLENMNARMTTASTVNPSNLATLSLAVENAKMSGSTGGTSMPITDMYGYIIDLAFRTNAADSDLLLQVEAADRIYSDNANEQTMGAGSTMTFTSVTTDFTVDQMKSLMNAIRIVFFDPGSSNVLATAKLDVNNAEVVGGNTATAKMYLYTMAPTTVTTYTEATYAADSDLTYYVAVEGEEGKYVVAADAAASAADGVKLYTATTTAGEVAETKDTTNVLTPLTQNVEQKVSVLVYLDGENVTNSSVAATAATSMTGTMNLQFASSANLIPMEYADLHIAGTPTEAGA